ncbi:hypothetical protein M9H77_07367 [Catharanthus roseus]|uniref:Uncharacterized protein n=1 Tax=Catharanthus roseus TaxID=4058 RepID=A0ACC0BUQ9_CATRO|nr:hypothetical protein M9H77_07367 [Catharanthus roseus]
MKSLLQLFRSLIPTQPLMRPRALLPERKEPRPSSPPPTTYVPSSQPKVPPLSIALSGQPYNIADHHLSPFSEKCPEFKLAATTLVELIGNSASSSQECVVLNPSGIWTTDWSSLNR